jgi:hypothetical protein
MISHINKFIYIDICKTAGTSITKSLKSLSNEQFEKFEYSHTFSRSGKHHSISNILGGITCTKITPHMIDSYFKFTFVRNPYDRIVSLYEWGQALDKYDKIPFKQFVKNIKDNVYDDFNKARYVPMVNWLTDPRDGKIKVDFVGRYENINEDFLALSKILNIDSKLTHVNKTSRKPILDYYDDDVIKWVYDLYKKDFEVFDYNIDL